MRQQALRATAQAAWDRQYFLEHVEKVRSRTLHIRNKEAFAVAVKEQPAAYRAYRRAVTTLQRISRQPPSRALLDREFANYNAARQRWVYKRPDEKAMEVLAFANRDLRSLNVEARTALSYDLRVLASAAVGWGVWRRLGPLSYRELKRIHAAVRTGVAALKATKLRPPADVLADPRAGWMLPRHRVRLWLPAPPAGAINNPTPLCAIYEASDEGDTIIARLGILLLQESQHCRICPCGCGEMFVKKGKQTHAYPACATRDRQKRWRRKEHLKEGQQQKVGCSTMRV